MEVNVTMKTLALSHWDAITLRRVLRRQQSRCLSDIAKHDARGWKPEPGRLDLSRVTLEQINGMLDRLGYPEDVRKVEESSND